MGEQQLIILIAAVSGVVLLLAVIFIISFIKKKGHKQNKIVEEIPAVKIDNNEWTNALGNKDNIKGVELKGSRLIVKLNNNELMNKESLHELGATSIIASEEKVTIVLKKDAEKIYELLK